MNTIQTVARTQALSQIRASVRLALHTGIAGILLAPAAWSATPAPESDALDEVVVTAQFREQKLQDIPLSITAISGDVLEARSQTSIADVANQAPNVTLKPNGAAFGASMGASIRGVGQFDFHPALEPGVGIYIDDVYFPTLTGSILDLLDVERVEILRGPQGTLSGKNSIGGSVKLFSKKPQGEGGYLSGTFGSRDRVDLRGSADFALSEGLFMRIAGVSKKQTGHVQRRDYGCLFPASGVPILVSVGRGCVVGTNGDVDYSAVRAQLRYVASDNLEISGAVDYTHDDRTAAGSVLVQGTATANRNIQPVAGVTNLPASVFVPPRGSYYNYASYYSPAGTFTAASGATTAMAETRTDGRARYNGWGGSFNVDWTIGDRVSLKSISAYRKYNSSFSNDNDLSPLAGSLGFGELRFHAFSQELRLNGAALADDRLDYTLGAFYIDQKTFYATLQDLRYNLVALTTFQSGDPVNADTKAVFGHLSFHVTDQLTLNTGLRHTDEHKDYTFSRRTRTGAVYAPLAAIHNLNKPYNGSKLDYRANVQYRWNDNVMSYVQFATGFKGGGISPRPFSALQAVPFDPEGVKSYEIGVKSDLLDRKLRLNASIFKSDYTDLQLTLTSCPQFGVGLPCAVVANAGDAEMKGAELEVELHPVAGLSIDGSYSYLDFDYTRINPQAGGPTRPTGPQFGMRPTYTPKTKLSLGMQYALEMGDQGSLTPRIDASYQSSVFSSGSNALTNRIGGYTVVNARLTWRAAESQWEASLEGTNITNKYYFLTRFDQFGLTGTTDGQPGRPRELALTVKRKF
jgi:iron complex outermembrane recepter protein